MIDCSSLRMLLRRRVIMRSQRAVLEENGKVEGYFRRYAPGCPRKRFDWFMCRIMYLFIVSVFFNTQ